VMNEARGFKINTALMDYSINLSPGALAIIIRILRAVSHNKQLAYSLFDSKNHGKVTTLLLLACEGPFEPVLADIFADGLTKHFTKELHALLWDEFFRHFLLEKEPVKNGNPLGMPIVDGSLRPDLYLAGLSQIKSET